MRFLIVCLVLFAGCTPGGDRADGADSASAGGQLEQAAIAAGIVPDLENMSLSGAYERVSDIGEDHFCAVGNDEDGYQVGMLAVFGPDTACEAIGTAKRNGEAIEIVLSAKEECRFTADFNGSTLVFPANLPSECKAYCGPRAGFDGVSFNLVGQGDDIARTTTGKEIRRLCPE